MIKKHFFTVLFLVLLSCVKVLSAQTNDLKEQEIRNMNLPGVNITEIQDIPAGNYTPKGGKMITNFPATLRVAFTLKPTTKSNIHNEIWIPKATWNGRFLGTGNGGGAGSINYGALVSGVIRGFATANTDMGTSAGVLEAVDNPEIWTDFGYRATHEMTVVAKTILKVYFKKQAHHSYFVGCSTGGQQALMEAQRYPDDYNGIIAGAPANNRTHLHSLFVWNAQANKSYSGNSVISQKKMALFYKLMIKKCLSKDGGAPNDTFLTDPRMCKINTQTIPRCPDENVNDSCFSNVEIAALNKIYDGPTNPRTGERIYSPLPLRGTQLDGNSYNLYPFKWVFGRGFDYTKFDFDHDMAKVDSILGPILNANNPDLEPLKKRGGKILMFTGTADQVVPFPDAINYYERVIEAQHGLTQTQDFFRYFLIPGMEHCGGGPGSNEFGQGLSLNVNQDGEHDILTAIVNWVERKIAPDKIIATNFNCCDSVNRVRFQRPIFPYPKFPHYIGGDPNSPFSYKGIDHPRGAILKPDQVYLK